MKSSSNPLVASVCVCTILIFSWFFFHAQSNQVQNSRHLLSTDSSMRPGRTIAQLSTNSKRNADLIMYSYHETDEAKKNLAFFLAHALHASADFILMLNGAHTVGSLLKNVTGHHSNIFIFERENRCFDLGGFHEILSNNRNMIDMYKRFIFINASLRGPFFPPWANRTCWSDAYWAKLDERVKLVGMSWNCANGIPYPAHLQSMILAFDQTTLKEILMPSFKCYESMESAVGEGETRLAGLVLEAGYDVFAMNGRFTAHAGKDGRNTTAFLEWCVDRPGRDWSGGNDILHTGNYEGSTLHPHETIFAKTNRDWDERDRKMIDLLTEHADLEGYSSYDRC